MEPVLAERDDAGVLTLTWNRPERRNGWAEDLEEACYGHLDRFIGGPDLREGVASFRERRAPAFLPLDSHGG